MLEKLREWSMRHQGWESVLEESMLELAEEIPPTRHSHLLTIRNMLAQAYRKDPSSFASGGILSSIDPAAFASRARVILEQLDSKEPHTPHKKPEIRKGLNTWESSPPYIHEIIRTERAKNPKFRPAEIIQRDYMNGGHGEAFNCLTGVNFYGKPSFLPLPFKRRRAYKANERHTFIRGPFNPIMPTILQMLHEFTDARQTVSYIFGAKCAPTEKRGHHINSITSPEELKYFLENAKSESENSNNLLPNEVLFIPEIDKLLEYLHNRNQISLKKDLINLLFITRPRNYLKLTPISSISSQDRLEQAFSQSGFNIREFYHLSRLSVMVTHLPKGKHTPSSDKEPYFTNLPVSNITGENALSVHGNHVYAIGKGNGVDRIIYAAQTNYWREFEVVDYDMSPY